MNAFAITAAGAVCSSRRGDHHGVAV